MSRSSSMVSSRRSSASQVNLVTLCNNDDTYSIKSLLYENQTINILEMRNAKQYTILHLACYNNNEALVDLYFNYLSAQVDKEVVCNKEIADWVNAQNDEGFCSLHLAAYRGNMRIINQIESHGGDFRIVNFNKLTVLHTAAQGDSPLASKGININSIDQKGSTPLHWAAYSGAYNAVNFLVTWNAKINQRDEDSGVTALHLAAMQGNTRIVRKLLMKGIDRSIKDFSGKTALDLAREADFKSISIMIYYQQDRMGLMEFCNIRQPFRPVEKRQQSLIGFLIMYITCLILTFIFTLPYVKDKGWLWAFMICTFQTIVYFLISWQTDPGFVQKDEKLTMLDMLKKYDCSIICADCQLVKPKRSKHCEVCQRCIMVYDHHCPWINNCVGAKNHLIFYFFILSLLLELILQFFMQIQHIQAKEVQRWHDWLPLDHTTMIIGKYTTFVYVLLYCAIFIIPLSVLVYIQTGNLLLGQTTYERHSFESDKAKNKSKSPDKQELLQINDNQSQSEYSDVASTKIKSQSLSSSQGKPSLVNCFEMCCANKSKSEYEKELGTEFMDRSI